MNYHCIISFNGMRALKSQGSFYTIFASANNFKKRYCLSLEVLKTGKKDILAAFLFLFHSEYFKGLV